MALLVRKISHRSSPVMQGTLKKMMSWKTESINQLHPKDKTSAALTGGDSGTGNVHGGEGGGDEGSGGGGDSGGGNAGGGLVRKAAAFHRGHTVSFDDSGNIEDVTGDGEALTLPGGEGGKGATGEATSEGSGHGCHDAHASPETTVAVVGGKTSSDKDKMVAEQVHLVVGHLQKEWEEHVNTLSLQLQRTKNELKQSKVANSRLVEQLELAGEIYKRGLLILYTHLLQVKTNTHTDL